MSLRFGYLRGELDDVRYQLPVSAAPDRFLGAIAAPTDLGAASSEGAVPVRR